MAQALELKISSRIRRRANGLQDMELAEGESEDFKNASSNSDPEGESEDFENASSNSDADSMPLIGKQVRICGLQSKPAWNGLKATVAGYNSEEKQYAVFIDGVAFGQLLPATNLLEEDADAEDDPAEERASAHSYFHSTTLARAQADAQHDATARGHWDALLQDEVALTRLWLRDVREQIRTRCAIPAHLKERLLRAFQAQATYGDRPGHYNKYGEPEEGALDVLSPSQVRFLQESKTPEAAYLRHVAENGPVTLNAVAPSDVRRGQVRLCLDEAIYLAIKNVSDDGAALRRLLVPQTVFPNAWCEDVGPEGAEHYEYAREQALQMQAPENDASLDVITPLCTAAMERRVECMTVLLDARADLHLPDTVSCCTHCMPPLFLLLHAANYRGDDNRQVREYKT